MYWIIAYPCHHDILSGERLFSLVSLLYRYRHTQFYLLLVFSLSELTLWYNEELAIILHDHIHRMQYLYVRGLQYFPDIVQHEYVLRKHK